jgi:hypothetical protein
MPDHDDRTESLSITYDPEHGRTLVCCHAPACGARGVEIADAYGHPRSDLYDSPWEKGTKRSDGPAETPARRRPVKRAPVKAKPAGPVCLGIHAKHDEPKISREPVDTTDQQWHTITDADGTVKAWKIRVRCLRPECGQKSRVAWRYPDRDTGRPSYGKNAPKPAEMPLYGLPAAREAITAGEPVYLTEGETDADAVTAAGATACTHGAADNGTGNHWRPWHTASLAGAREVIVCQDRDDPGRVSAQYIAQQLTAAGIPARIVEPTEGKDVRDHLTAGLTLDQLRDVPLADDEDHQGDAEDTAPQVIDLREDQGDTDTSRSNVVQLPGSDPAPEGRPVPGSPGWSYLPGVGIWRGRNQVLTWCPVVSRHLVNRGSRGDVTGRRMTIDVGGATATVPASDVADGAVWVDRFPTAAGVATRDMRDVLRNVIDDQAARLPQTTVTPEWIGGRLVLPPEDVLPRGYGVTAGTTDDFRAIVERAAQVPKLALVMGLAVGGLYVGPLDFQSFLVHLPGRGRQGKTTAERLAAAVFGRPSDVVLPWNTTENGIAAWLREAAILTGFRDELGATGWRSDRLSSTVFRITQGAERDISGRKGEHRDSRGSWHGALFSTGNEAITSQIANEGIAARVLEISAPLTPSADYAEDLETLVRRGYGHGLSAIVESGPTPEELADWLPKIHAAVGVPGGGVERTLGKSLALGVAGGRVLGDLFDVASLEPAALVAARETLVELAAALTERGASPGDRLLRAIESAMSAQPGAFPTREFYEKATGGAEGRLPHEVLGWDLTDDTLPGDVAIITGQLGGIAEAEGIADTTVALKELARRNPAGLLTANDGKHLARLVKVGGKPRRTYVFMGLNAEPEAQAGPNDGGNHPDEDPVTTSVTTSVTTPDLRGNHRNHFEKTQVVHEGGPEARTCPECRGPLEPDRDWDGAVCLACFDACHLARQAPEVANDGLPVACPACRRPVGGTYARTDFEGWHVMCAPEDVRTRGLARVQERNASAQQTIPTTGAATEAEEITSGEAATTLVRHVGSEDEHAGVAGVPDGSGVASERTERLGSSGRRGSDAGDPRTTPAGRGSVVHDEGRSPDGVPTSGRRGGQESLGDARSRQEHGDTRQHAKGPQRGAQRRSTEALTAAPTLGVLGHTGGTYVLYRQDVEGVELPDVDGTRAGIHALAQSHGLRTLAVHVSAAAALGWPTEPQAMTGRGSALAVPGWTDTEDGRESFPVGGVASWVNVWTPGPDGHRESPVGVHVPCLDDRPAARWRDAQDGAELLSALVVFRAVLGDSYYFSPNATGAQVARKHSRGLAEK